MPISLLDLSLIQLVIAVGLGASTACYLIGLYSAHDFFRRRKGEAPEAPRRSVTVLKPLKGIEVGLYENLESLCRQRYDDYQLVFGVADPEDPAIAVVRRLRREHPERDIELVVDGRVYGANYKISNLHNMYQHAKHEVIVIADSDIRVGRDYLRRVVAGLEDPHVGLVTCLYRAVNAGRWPTAIESLFINTDFSGLVLLARQVEQATYAFGATIAMRRAVLDEIGGFLPIVDYLADDYHLGHRVAALGYELALSDEVVETVISVESWHRLWAHQLRWARTYRICRPGGYFGSILTHGTFWALLNVVYHQLSPLSCLCSLAVLGVRYASAVALTWRYLRADTHPLEMALVAPKDLFVSLVWFIAFAGNSVRWSGRRFLVQRTGEMVDVTPEPLPAWAPGGIPALPEEPQRTGTDGG